MLKLLLAIALGGVVGLERELSGKPAGLRTNILICLGATIITDLSVVIAQSVPPNQGDPGRIAAQIVTGIGFIGAGTILRTRGAIHGLTSAATIWVVAAIGMLLGAGSFLAAAGTTALVMLVLIMLGRFEDYVLSRRRVRGTIRVALEVPVSEIREILQDNGLCIDTFDVRETKRSRVVDIRVHGSSSSLRSAAEELDDHDGVVSLDLA